jgi:DNA-binding XRE family transcriptional regulator
MQEILDIDAALSELLSQFHQKQLLDPMSGILGTLLAATGALCLPQSEPVKASDGTLWKSEWAARLHEAFEPYWQRMLPTLQDGQNVRQARFGLRVTQKQLAQEVGISRPMLAMIESGKRKMNEAMILKVWGALCRLDEQYKRTPAYELFVRLDRAGDGALLGILTMRERIEAL